MGEGKIRLGRFDKYGYKNNFSKGELAKELVYANEDNDNLKQALNEIREYVKTLRSYHIECELQDKKLMMFASEENFIKDILQIIDKVDLGDEK